MSLRLTSPPEMAWDPLYPPGGGCPVYPERHSPSYTLSGGPRKKDPGCARPPHPGALACGCGMDGFLGFPAHPEVPVHTPTGVSPASHSAGCTVAPADVHGAFWVSLGVALRVENVVQRFTFGIKE